MEEERRDPAGAEAIRRKANNEEFQ